MTGAAQRQPDRESTPRHHGAPETSGPSTARLALAATAHCLAGCSIGEILGMVAGSGLGWGAGSTVLASVALAFVFGYAFTVVPLLRSGLGIKATLRLALASDTISIVVMEVVDNGIMLLVPGAMDAGLADPLFWTSLAGSLLLAGLAALPVNRWLIARGRGHALVHARHESPADPQLPGKAAKEATEHRRHESHGGGGR